MSPETRDTNITIFMRLRKSETYFVIKQDRRVGIVGISIQRF
jgi:hypothetical protein